MSRPRLFGLIAAPALIFVVVLLIALRAWLVDRGVGAYLDCRGCFHGSVIQADLLLLGLVAGGLLLASFLPRRVPARLVHLSIGVLMLVYLADLLVFKLFSTRLFLSDIALFAPHAGAVWDQFSGGVGGPFYAVLLLLSLPALFVLLWRMPRLDRPASRLALAATVLLTAMGGVALDPPPYVNDWATTNVFSANLSTSQRVPYSQDYLDRLAEQPAAQARVHHSPHGSRAGRNVIIVLLESWSAWHSRLFGGTLDWTPRLDRAAQRGLVLDNLHSIGFSTDQGLVGSLAGEPLWAPFLHWFETPPFEGMWDLPDTLPGVFSRHGYHTAFLTTGPLTLYRKGEWLQNLGFDFVEGNESRFYRGQRKFALRSAPDHALYQRAQAWLSEARTPWLLVLETLTTHQPYQDPDTREYSLEKAMRYADRELGDFIDALDDGGFFADGLLMVLSDHRSMTPVSADELALFGHATFSRIPGFVIGADILPGSIERHLLSQSDLAPSFDWWLGRNARLGEHDAVVFDAGSAPGRCVFHSRGDQRGLLEVNCADGHGQIKLDGDRTRFTQQQGLDPVRQESLLRYVARARLRNQQRPPGTDQQ